MLMENEKRPCLDDTWAPFFWKPSPGSSSLVPGSTSPSPPKPGKIHWTLQAGAPGVEYQNYKSTTSEKELPAFLRSDFATSLLMFVTDYSLIVSQTCVAFLLQSLPPLLLWPPFSFVGSQTIILACQQQKICLWKEGGVSDRQLLCVRS